MTPTNPRTLAPLDIFIILCLVAGAVGFWPFLASHSPATVVVFRDNTAIARYPLASDKVFTVRGKDGPMTLAVKNNGVRVIESRCPRGICIRTGAIRMQGQQIVCAPNHILVELETSSESKVDGVSQ
jgi:hypothetical protein